MDHLDGLSGVAGELAVEPVRLPACMDGLVRGYEWARITGGEGGGAVYRLHRGGRVGRGGNASSGGSGSLYLKYGRGAIANDITDEMVRLRWMADRFLVGGRRMVPEVRHFVASGNEAWLLMTEVPGRTARRVLNEEGTDRVGIVDSLVDALGGFLRQLHALPIESCPFNSDHRLRLSQARERLAAGLIDGDDFDDEHAGWTAAQVWDQLTGLLPIAVDPVVTHGDLSLDNVLIDGGAVVGVVDVGRAGIADRYQDLAILAKGVGEFDDSLRERLFASYGIAVPDQRKLRFHAVLDEFF
jgi:aminoglycoside 3'-phosphotransferase-1